MKNLSNENVIHVRKDGVEFLQFRRLLEYSDVVNHAYSLGINTNFRTARINKKELSKEEYEKAISDYKNITAEIGSSYINVVKTNQEHTNCVKVVEKKINADAPDFNLEEYMSIDGLITNQRKIMLSTTNADCILLLFFDPVKNVVANTHSGWRGTLQKISVTTVEKMIEKYGCNPNDIICCICPSIRKCHFEVDKEVRDLFYDEFKDLKNINEIIEKQKDIEKWNIDTVLINKTVLMEKGLKSENIIDSGICSVCNSDLVHSYRVEKEGYGLATALIELK